MSLDGWYEVQVFRPNTERPRESMADGSHMGSWVRYTLTNGSLDSALENQREAARFYLLTRIRATTTLSETRAP